MLTKYFSKLKRHQFFLSVTVSDPRSQMGEEGSEDDSGVRDPRIKTVETGHGPHKNGVKSWTNSDNFFSKFRPALTTN